MKTEKGVVAVTYKEGDRNPRFLVLKRKKNWEGWESPKGHLENGDYRMTVKQELEEEAAVNEGQIQGIEDLEEEISWTHEKKGEKIRREYKAYLVKVDKEAHVDVSENPHDEHEKGFFFRYRDARPLLTYEDNQILLDKAMEKIKKKSR